MKTTKNKDGKIIKKENHQKMTVIGEDGTSEIKKFRDFYLNKKIELVDITPHIKFGLGYSGWCNEFNEPDEKIYHVQVKYRDEVICNLNSSGFEVLDDKKYVVFKDDKIDGDFIIFRKVKL